MRRLPMFVSAVLCSAAIGGAGLSTATATASPADGSDYATLSQLSCPSATSCVAVGQVPGHGQQVLTLIVRGIGSRWKVQRSPDVPGAVASLLLGVSCHSAAMCVAVGDYTKTSGTRLPMAERWNGRTWSMQSVPAPAGAHAVYLGAVQCLSVRYCLAAGSWDNTSGASKPLAAQWNGHEWTLLPAIGGGLAGASFDAVSCVRAGSCVAAGEYAQTPSLEATLAERWNGHGWTNLHSSIGAGASNSNLASIWCWTSTSCIAAGFGQGPAATEPLILKWNGHVWTFQFAPGSLPLYAVANGITCGTGYCEAVGFYQVGDNDLAYAIRSSAEAWTFQQARNPGDKDLNDLMAVQCPAVTECVAVGDYARVGQPRHVLIEQWNGRSWATDRVAE